MAFVLYFHQMLYTCISRYKDRHTDAGKSLTWQRGPEGKVRALVLEELRNRPVVLKLLWTTKQVGKIFENSPQKNVHKTVDWRLPGGPVAKTLGSRCRGPRLIPGQGSDPHAAARFMSQLRPSALSNKYLKTNKTKTFR